MREAVERVVAVRLLVVSRRSIRGWTQASGREAQYFGLPLKIDDAKVEAAAGTETETMESSVQVTSALGLVSELEQELREDDTWCLWKERVVFGDPWQATWVHHIVDVDVAETGVAGWGRFPTCQSWCWQVELGGSGMCLPHFGKHCC